MPDLNVTSAAAAFARQAAAEARVTSALTTAMNGFLSGTLRLALAQGRALGAASVTEQWFAHMSAEALGERLAQDTADYVAAGLADSSVPSDAFTSIGAVLQRADEQAWSASETEAALRAALSPEGGATHLVAPEALTAAAVVKRDADGRPVYRATAGLDEGGSSWISRMRAEARTAVTGLDGILSTEAMRRQGFGYKMWVTQRDEHVREAHREADGQVVPLDSPFTVDGYPMMYPGERGAPAGLAINCRCIIRAVDHPVSGSTALPFLAP